MRRLFAAISAVAVLATAGATTAFAQDYPWCLQGRDWGYPGLCHFASYAQCLATASGTFSYCGINPYVAFAPQQRGYWRGAYGPNERWAARPIR
jgi:hypothetical protein